jgi:hypothetical protein
MKSTPKIFARIALVFKLILGFEIAVGIIFLAISLFNMEGYKLLNNGSRLKLDTAGHFKKLTLDSKHISDTISSIGNGILRSSISEPKQYSDSLVTRNKRIKFYKNGELVFSKSIDSMNKANKKWFRELYLKLRQDDFKAKIREADSLIKIGHLSFVSFDSTGSSFQVGATRMFFEFDGGVHFIYEDELKKQFRGTFTPKITLANNMILQKVSDKFRVEFIATDSLSFDAIAITCLAIFFSNYSFLVRLIVTYLLYRFFTVLSEGENFSNRQGKTFNVIGYIFLLTSTLFLSLTIYQNYIFRKYLELKGAELSHKLRFDDIQPSIIYLALGLICLALAQVFKYGMKIEKDNERTI